jgi:hypothetical protein
MVNVVTLNYENSLDRFISEEKNVVYKTVSYKKLAGWVGGWVSWVKDCLQQSKTKKRIDFWTCSNGFV